MELNMNNWFARYYVWIYGDYPKDLCSFFWGLVVIILLAIIVIPGRLLVGSPRWNDGLYLYIGVGIIVWFFYYLLITIGQGVMENFDYILVGFWGLCILGLFIGILTIIIAALLVATPIAAISGIAELYKIWKHKAPKNDSYQGISYKTKTWIGAIKGKYCTKITWK